MQVCILIDRSIMKYSHLAGSSTATDSLFTSGDSWNSLGSGSRSDVGVPARMKNSLSRVHSKWHSKVCIKSSHVFHAIILNYK